MDGLELFPPSSLSFLSLAFVASSTATAAAAAAASFHQPTAFIGLFPPINDEDAAAAAARGPMTTRGESGKVKSVNKDNLNDTLLRRDTFVREILSKCLASITMTRLIHPFKGHPNPSMPAFENPTSPALIGVESCLEELALGSANIYVQRACTTFTG